MQITSTTVDSSSYDKSAMEINNNQGELSSGDFLSLFITQLKNQDPTNPMDDSALMEQTSTFTQVELMTNMEGYLEKIAGGSENANMQSQMASAASFIGKIVEYEGNDTYLHNGAGAISFQADQVPKETTVVVKDSQGNFVRSFSTDVRGTDMNTFYWDGTDANGNYAGDGKYSFAVVAKGADGEDINIKTYGNGLVTGIKTTDGSLVYEVDGSDIKSEYITSVRDASLGGA
ncbi:MAG: hypothetical protein C0602_05690 [Denitrovibrio sp.]|nr:MAG: hypothetical protein C0602_05690 [Denitrovibrio sp.]